MKKIALSLLALVTVAACTQELSPEDRANIDSARTEAHAARVDANQAALAAQAASDKADRIYRQGQYK